MTRKEYQNRLALLMERAQEYASKTVVVRRVSVFGEALVTQEKGISMRDLNEIVKDLWEVKEGNNA